MQDNFDQNENKDFSNEVADQTPAPSSVADENATTEIIGVCFKKNGKTYYFAPNGFNLTQNTRVIVDTSRGQEYGFVAVANRQVKNSQLSEPLRCILRVATDDDTKIYEENAKKEVDAYNTCIDLIDKHRLSMKLVDTELSFDRSKMLFYFSAEERVDFRELVKDLAATFHTRIEMRQIGIRDEAKLLGGLGICGRPYCCSTFLNDFGQVSVKMAKEQNLSLNTAKISGSCGKLMCCLRYEYDTYISEKAITPKVDARVITPSGAGVVTATNPLAGIVKVRLDSMGEDSDPVLFVRDDVVSENDYDGRPLIKTDIPKHGKKSDDIPSFADLDSPAVKIPVDESSSAPATVQTPVSTPVTESSKEGEGEQHRGKNHRHKKHKKKISGQNQNQGQGQNQNQGQGQNQNQSQGQNQNRGQNNKNSKNNASGQQVQNTDRENGGSHKKKKKFFHHHGGDGQNKNQNTPKN